MLIFLDLETTGLEKDAKICAIGIIALDAFGERTCLYDLVNEGKKIPPQASAIHHITNEMIAQKPKMRESQAYKFLLEHNTPDTTIIAHNIAFDMEKLLACGYIFAGETIDTLRTVKHLIPECELFALQFLRYELKLYAQEPNELLACGVDTSLMAHHALGDALVTKLLYEYLLDSASREKMIALTQQKILMQKLPFGKYQGRYIEEIVECERGYLEWFLSNIMDLDEDLRYSIDYFLRGDR